GRALLVVHQAQPHDFTGNLTLTPTNTKVKLFDNESHRDGETAWDASTGRITNASLGTPRRFWLEGAQASDSIGDTAVQLGIADVEPIGDLAAATVVALSITGLVSSTDAKTHRSGLANLPALGTANFPVAQQSVSVGGSDPLLAADYEDEFAAVPPR